MSCEQYKSRIADVAAAFRPARDTGPGFSPASSALDPELDSHLAGCPACRAELDAQCTLLASIDRGVTSLVAGNPSPEFAARVRQRIAEEASAPRAWFAGWVPVTAAALALLALVAFLSLRRPPREPQSAQMTPRTQAAPSVEEAAAKAPPAVAHGPRPLRPGQMAARREPEVLVPRGEMAAVMRLYNATWSGQADGASLVAAVKPMSDALRPLAVAELNIPLLEVVPQEGGGRPKGSSENQ